MGDDLVQQTLALMGAADGEAPQGVAEAAAGADDVVNWMHPVVQALLRRMKQWLYLQTA